MTGMKCKALILARLANSTRGTGRRPKLEVFVLEARRTTRGAPVLTSREQQISPAEASDGEGGAYRQTTALVMENSEVHFTARGEGQSLL